MNKQKIFGMIVICLLVSLILFQFITEDEEQVKARDYGSFLDYLNQNPDVAQDLHSSLYVNEETDYPTYLHWVYSKIN